MNNDLTFILGKLNTLVNTADGSHTIYVPELDEHYHSIYGAVQESEFIFINKGYDYCKSDPLFILEIGFGYHNHDFEFDTVEGKVPYFDVFLPEIDKDLLTMELDLFWTTKAGQDPVEIFKKYPGRFQLFHMKDMLTKKAPIFTTNGVNDFAPVGTGLIDFKRILAAKKTAGMKYMIVEQDNAGENKPFEAIKTSITNLVTKILV